MNAFSSKNRRSCNTKSELYRGGSYLSMKSDPTCEIYEQDIYSDVSLDTSSHDDTWYANQGNHINYSRSGINHITGSSYMHHGPTDIGDDGLGRFPELYHNSWYSDDEMGELLSLDDSIFLSNKMLEEQEELRYLTELVYQDIAATEYYDDQVRDFFRSQTSIWEDTYDDDEFLRREQLLYQEEISKLNFNHSMRAPESDITTRTFYSDDTERKDMGKHTSEPKPRAKRNSEEIEKQQDVPKVVSENQIVENGSSTSNKSSDSDIEQKIFLGGLPLGMTERGLRQELAAQGYKVLKRPKIIRGFAPQVLMSSVKEAKALVEKGVITINGSEVQVRPFNSFMKQSKSKKIPNVGKRSIFLGGLPSGSTPKNIKEVFMKMGMNVVNYPVVKFGYARQVILETVAQAKTLINMKRVLINGVFVDVRPFMKQ